MAPGPSRGLRGPPEAHGAEHVGFDRFPVQKTSLNTYSILPVDISSLGGGYIRPGADLYPPPRAPRVPGGGYISVPGSSR